MASRELRKQMSWRRAVEFWRPPMVWKNKKIVLQCKKSKSPRLRFGGLAAARRQCGDLPGSGFPLQQPPSRRFKTCEI